MKFRWMAGVSAAALVALVLAACGGGTDRTKAQLRLVNASNGYAQIDLRVDDQLRQTPVAYGGTAGYVEVDPGKAATVISSTGSATPLLSFMPSVAENKYFTVLAYGRTGALQQVLLDDNAGAPDNNRTLLRVVNAAPDAGAIDIYLTGTDESLATAVPVQAAAAVGGVGAWLTVSSISWRLRITAASSKTDVRLDVPALALTSRQIATLVLTPGRGGVLVNALLLNQQGPITRQDNTQARARVAAGLGDGAVVGVRVGSTTLSTNGSGLAAVGDYQLLAAGTQNVVMSVGGLVLEPAVYNFEAGADYTLVAYGTTLAPALGRIDDDNRLPTDTSKAQVRLVNGVAGLAAPLAMTINGVSVPSSGGVAAGAGSAYTPITGSTTAGISVSAAGLPAPLYTATTQTLAAGSGYTVFVLGSSSSAAGFLRSDR